MNDLTRQHLNMLDARHEKHPQTKKRLKVFYGWSKINKIQKREAIAVAFENEELAGDESRRSGKSIRKTMTVCYERYQTEAEMRDAPFHNRVFTVYNVFLNDKRIGGSLKKALADNASKDSNHVTSEEQKKISRALETAFMAAHPTYREPTQQLTIPFDE